MKKNHLRKSNTISWLKTKTKQSKVGIASNFLNMVKDVYEKPTANNTVIDEEKAFSLWSGIRQGC